MSGTQRVQDLSHGWLSKLWSLFGSLLQYGAYYLGYPKRGHNFDNYPHLQRSASGKDSRRATVSVQGVGLGG